MRPFLLCFSFLLPLLVGNLWPRADTPGRGEVLEAMRRATTFMMDQVSERGGFVWQYSADLSEQWGPVPAWKTQAWIMPPSTPTVGSLLLQAWRATGEAAYLRHADKVAGALIFGQHRSGGWDYLMDFEPAQLPRWYREVGLEARGWEEYYHFYDNATFDDDVTASAVRFLHDLYVATGDPKYRPALLKSYRFLLEAQYPNGAWPQRFPVREDFPSGGRPDFTGYYTFNDDVISSNVRLLIQAYRSLGDKDYLEAARRGMDFYILSQLPSPQSGWAQQYDYEMRPAWGAGYEPAAVGTLETVRNIEDLLYFYAFTADRRYLDPIPRALGWLESSVLDSRPQAPFSHATHYEPGTNKALYAHHVVGAGGRLEGYRVDYDPHELPHSYTTKVDLAGLRDKYERIRRLAPPEALLELERKAPAQPPSGAEVRRLIQALDDRGAWVQDMEVPSFANYADHPPRKLRGIETGVYVQRMGHLIRFLEEMKP